MRTRATVMLAVLASAMSPLQAEVEAEYIAGTVARVHGGSKGSLELADETYLAYYAGDAQVRIPYEDVNLLEYGQQVNRRLALALVISPIFLLSKSRKHFLTIGFTDARGVQQAMVFRVDKNAIRATLVGLEARTGLTVDYQDQEARKAGGF